MKSLNKFVFALFSVAFALVMAGCNTIEGMGKDIKKAGQAIEGTAEKAK